MRVWPAAPPAFTLALALAAGAPAQRVDLTVTAPAFAGPGTAAAVRVDHTGDVDFTRARGVLILQMLDAETEAVLATAVHSDGVQGLRAAAGSHEFQAAVPPGAPPAIAFRAFMAPYGLNHAVQAHTQTYPADGTYPYEWTGNGVTQNLYYLGGLVISVSNPLSTYCSGITYETFLLTNVNYRAQWGLPPAIGTMNLTQMRAFRRLWYGATGVPDEDERQSALAIERHGLGFILTDREDARPGDFIQFWRHSGSGHNCVFQSWRRDGQGQINGLRYFSAQSGTNGPGLWTETVSASSGINPGRIYIARVMKPRAADDWDLRYGDADTLGMPTSTVAAAAPQGLLLR